MVVVTNLNAGGDQATGKTTDQVVKKAERTGSKETGTWKMAIVNSSFVRNLTIGKSLYIHRIKFGLVTIVGFVDEIEETPECLEFKLKDSEGSIKVQRYKAGPIGEAVTVKSEGGGDSLQNITATWIQNGTLVRVVGNPQTLKNSKPMISAFKILQITDLNELTCHSLEVLSGVLTFRKLKQNHLNHVSLIEGFPTLSVERKITLKEDNRIGEQKAIDVEVETKPRVLVLNVIKQCLEPTGISIPALRKSLPQIKATELRVILNDLLHDGHIYTTFDDDHFRAT